MRASDDSELLRYLLKHIEDVTLDVDSLLSSQVDPEPSLIKSQLTKLSWLISDLKSQLGLDSPAMQFNAWEVKPTYYIATHAVRYASRLQLHDVGKIAIDILSQITAL